MSYYDYYTAPQMKAQEGAQEGVTAAGVRWVVEDLCPICGYPLDMDGCGNKVCSECGYCYPATR